MRKQAADPAPAEQAVALPWRKVADLIALIGRPPFSDAASAGSTNRAAPSARAGSERRARPRSHFCRKRSSSSKASV